MCLTDHLLTAQAQAVLEHAREQYGEKQQLIVAAEELNELACVLLKFSRYDTPGKAIQELRSQATEEAADVLVVLDHVFHIFGIDEGDIMFSIESKIARLERWLQSASTLEVSTEDREVRDETVRI